MKPEGQGPRNSRYTERKPRRFVRRIERLEVRDLLAADPWQNPVNPLDVLGTGQVTPADALAVIDALNNNGGSFSIAGPAGSVAPQSSSGSTPAPVTATDPHGLYLDVLGTGVVTPQDALAIINQLNTGTQITISLETVDASGNPITSVVAGSTFTLEAFVQDTRGADATGVESAYSDISYDSSLATISPTATITYPSDFPSTQNGNTSSVGVINQIGAAATTAPASVGAPELLWSVPVTASSTATGTLNFINGPDISDNSTLFGSAAAVPTTGINYLSTSIQVVPVPLPQLTVNSVSVQEPSVGGATANFQVTLSAPSANTVTVGYSTANNTAIAGTDYSTISGTALTFQPGQTTQTVSVPILHNPNFDVASENFFLNLSSPVNATVEAAQGTATIFAQLSSVSIQGTTVIEDASNPPDQSASFLITVSPPSPLPISITYSTADVTAIANNGDYTAVTNAILNIPAHTANATITVPIGETVTTGSKSFDVNLDSAVNGNITASQGAATLLPPNSQSSGYLAAVSVKITDLLGNVLTTLNPGENFLAQIDVQDVDPNLVTTNAGVYEAYTDLSWTPGVAETTPGTSASFVSPYVTATHFGNTTVANTITDIGAIASGTTPTGADVTELVTIPMTVTGVGALTFTPSPANDQGGDVLLYSDNLLPSTLTDAQIDDIPSATVSTGNNGFSITGPGDVNNVLTGQTTATFTITRSSPDSQTITIPVSTVNGTAMAGTDYEPLTNFPVTFPGGATTETVTVTIIGNSVIEPNKTFSVVLGTPTPAGSVIAGETSATATIVSTAPAPSLSVADASATEEQPVQFVVNLSAPSTQTITVNYATGAAISGTPAVANVDYAPTSGTITFPPGNQQQSILVDTLFDAENTAGVNFQLNLSSPVGATLQTSSAVGTILPAPPISTTGISGYVYVDTNDNGEFDSNEIGLSGVTVTLTDTTTGVTTTTSSSGAVSGGSVTSVALISGGSGYTSAPSVVISGGGGEGATAVAVINASDVVTSILVTGGGGNYTSAPTVTLSGGGGSGAAAIADTGISITTSAGTASAATLSSGGTGYTSPPVVTISGGGGTGATATAKINASGVVTSIIITNQGGGYTAPPAITFSGGGGSGATATVTLSGLGFYIFTGLTPGDTYTVTKTNPGFFADGNKIVSVATPTPTGVITPDEYSGIVMPVNGTGGQNFNFPELGLRAEFVSSFLNRRAFLSSSIITGEYGPTVVNSSQTFNLQQGAVWISYDNGWEGVRTFSVSNFNPSQGNVTLQLFDNNLNLLASSTNGQLSFNGVIGAPYFLEITGTNPNVELQVSGGTIVAVSFAVTPAVSTNSQAATVAAVSAATTTPTTTSAGKSTTSQTTVAAVAVAQTPATKTTTATDQALEQNTNWLSTALFA